MFLLNILFQKDCFILMKVLCAISKLVLKSVLKVPNTRALLLCTCLFFLCTDWAQIVLYLGLMTYEHKKFVFNYNHI